MGHDDLDFTAVLLEVRVIRSRSGDVFVHISAPSQGFQSSGARVQNFVIIKDIDGLPVQEER